MSGTNPLKPTIPPVGWLEFRAIIERIHVGAPERLKKARAFLQNMQESVDGLANLGQPLLFSFGPDQPVVPFPIQMYRGKQWTVVQTAAQQATLAGQGWVTTPVPNLVLNQFPTNP
jgi:hypothetical protein